MRRLALAVGVAIVLVAPLAYFGILFATRDPVLNSLDRLEVPGWAAQQPEDQIISGSRWCLIDCRFRERTLVSSGEPAETTDVYQDALREAGWVEWIVEGCPQVEVDGDYSCWRRDEYTLDLWVRPPECAYDPLNLRPELDEDADGAGDGEQPGADPEDDGDNGAPADGDDCTGSVVQIKMQNRVSDDRGLPRGPARSGVPPTAGATGGPDTTPTAQPRRLRGGGGSRHGRRDTPHKDPNHSRMVSVVNR